LHRATQVEFQALHDVCAAASIASTPSTASAKPQDTIAFVIRRSS
jgi:hypothetical protein